MQNATLTQLPPGVLAATKGELLCVIGNLHWAGHGRAPKRPYVVVHWYAVCSTVFPIIRRCCTELSHGTFLHVIKPELATAGAATMHKFDAAKITRCQCRNGCRWGQHGEGVSLPCSSLESVSFPVCCGPKYMTRYLRDCGVLRLVIIEFTGNQDLGQVSVPVHVLDVDAPVRGTFPVVTASGQRVASLDVHLELVYNAPATSFELNEHMASLLMGRSHAHPTVTTWTSQTAPLEAIPEGAQESGVVTQDVMQQLDVSEVLHASISR